MKIVQKSTMDLVEIQNEIPENEIPESKKRNKRTKASPLALAHLRLRNLILQEGTLLNKQVIQVATSLKSAHQRTKFAKLYAPVCSSSRVLIKKVLTYIFTFQLTAC